MEANRMGLDANLNPGRVSTASLPKMVAKTVDTVINSSPTTLKILGNQKPWKEYFPIKYQVGITGKNFDGLDKFSTSLSNSFARMEFDPTGYEINVALSQMEIDVSKARTPVIDMIARELESRSEDMIDAIATQFNTLQTGKAFLSIIDAADDETLGASTYGGLDRSTYGLTGTYTNTAGAMSLTTLRTKFSACTHGNAKPDLIPATKVNWNRYEALVSAASTSGQIIYTNTGYPQMTRTGIAPSVQALRGQRGFDVLWFSGAPFVQDESVPTNYLYMLNTDYLKFYGVKSLDKDSTPVKFGKGSIDSVYTDVPKVTGFAFTGFNKPIDQYGHVGHILLMGDLISHSPRHLGIEIGYTS
jgi:hypothetical protein